MTTKILKILAVEATFPGGRVVKGFSRSYPGGQGDGILHIFEKEGAEESHLINIHLAESVKLTPTFES
ncbi:hypothetical protein [Serratia fonticola]